MTREQRTARLTLLIDPDKKAVFERLCAIDDVTPSQVIRRLIREFIEQKTGKPWRPGERPEPLPAKVQRGAGAPSKGKLPSRN